MDDSHAYPHQVPVSDEQQHPSDVLAPAFVLSLGIGYSPALYHPFFAVRAAVLLLVVGPALFALVVQARTDVLARLLLAFVGVAGFATAFSRHPWASLWGEPNWGTGLLFVAVAGGIWAWARTLTHRAVARCRLALFGAVLANVGIAVLQRIDAVPSILESARAFGVTGNPVHLGALCAATSVLVVRERRLDPLGAIVIVAASIGVQLSGGRSALLLLVIGVGIVALRTRAIRTLAVLALLCASGIALASLLPGAAENQSATSRAVASESSGSTRIRVDIWEAGALAATERPLLGHGPGRFGAATSPLRSLAVARIGGDARFTDAHNIFVEVLTTTGFLGLLLFLLWSGRAAFAARGDWSGVALLLLGAHLLQPLSLTSTPVMALALGISCRRAAPATSVRERRGLLLFPLASAAAGALAAVALLSGEVQLQRGSVEFDRAAVASAESLLPQTWSSAPLVALRVEGFYAAQDAAARPAAVAAARRAVQADPANDQAWVRLGDLEGVWGSRLEARQAYAAALQRNPWSLGALRGAAKAAADDAEVAQAAVLCRKLKRATAAGSCGGRPLVDW